MKRLHSMSIVLAILLIIDSKSLTAQDWHQFRGPNGNGVIDKVEHPMNWGEDSNIAWSVEVPGGGLASPIVVGDKVLIATANGAPLPVSFAEGVRDMRPKRPEGPVKFQVICVSLKDGSTQWQSTVVEKQPDYPIHGSNSYATETPVSDGELIYVYFANAGVIAALDMNGKEVWKQDIGAYPTGNGFGSGSSLTMGEGLVFIQCDNDESSFVVALDKVSGETVWKKERAGRTSWSTPILWKNKERTELITCGSAFVTSYDPATGDELWTVTDVSSAFSASPASDPQAIYLGNSGPRSSGPLLAILAGMKGTSAFDPGQSVPGLAWSEMQAGPGMASPVATNGHLYIPGRGILTCRSTENGEVVYKERLSLGSMAASLWADSNHVFLLDENGTTLVISTDKELKVVATNELDDLFWSTPAISGKSLIMRGVKRLYCIRK